MLRLNLDEFSIAAVVQMLLHGGRTGRVSLVQWPDSALWLSGGEVWHAAALGREGPEALSLLSAADQGELHFGPSSDLPVARTVTAPHDAVLRQWITDAEFWQAQARVFPDWNATLRFTARWSPDQTITRAQYQALGGVGRLSLAQMITRSPLPPRQLVAVLAQFVEAGLVEAATG